MIRYLVHRPIAVFVSFFAVLILGIIAFGAIPTSLLPDTQMPYMTVRLRGNNLSAVDMERLMAAPMRGGLMQTDRLTHMESFSSEGVSEIKLSFEHGTDMQMRLIEVNEKVDMMMNRLPAHAERPAVIMTNINDIPVYHLSISFVHSNTSVQDFAGLSLLTNNTFRRQLEQLPEVALVDLTGSVESQIKIIPDYGRLHALGLNGEVIRTALDDNRITLGNILVQDGHYQYYLKIAADLETITSLKRLPLAINGRIFKLSDLADIRLEQKDSDGAFYTQYSRAIDMTIIKKSSARMEDLQQQVDKQLSLMRKSYPDLRFDITQDQSRLLDYTISNLWQDLWMGGLLAFVLMLIFIRKIKPALLIAVTIPLSLFISQLGFYLFGISMNIVSLGGLILGLGMIMDNSIVVIDTINRYKNIGIPVKDAVIAGTEEIVRPLITSLLTNCAIFIPLIFMYGLVGAIFYEQALAIIIGVSSSLLVAIILLPVLCSKIYSTHVLADYELKAKVNVTKWYEYGLQLTLRFPLIVLGIAAGIFCCSILIYQDLDKKQLPDIPRQDFEVRIDWNENIGVEENWLRIRTLLQQSPVGADTVNSWVGVQQYLLEEQTQSQSGAKLYVNIKPAYNRDSVQMEFGKIAYQQFPEASFVFEASKNAFDAVFSDRQAPLLLKISMPDQQLPAHAILTRLTDSLQHYIPGSYINPVSGSKQLEIRLKTEMAVRAGITVNELTKALESAFKPISVAHLNGDHPEAPILITAAPYHSIQQTLDNTFILKNNGNSIPVSSFVEFRKDSSFKTITAGVSGVYYPLEIHTVQPQKDLPVIRNLIKTRFADLDISYGGSYFEHHNLLKKMLLILGVSILLLYLILAAQFESLIQPLFILVELPVALSGALLFLYIGNSSINLMSLIGLVVMCGLIINDSILKIDAINQLRKSGMSLQKAICEGGHKRLKPILMIAFTSIGVLLPTLFMKDIGSSLQQPLALTLIGGMISGLFASLFLVPAVYWLVFRKKKETIQNFKNQHSS